MRCPDDVLAALGRLNQDMDFKRFVENYLRKTLEENVEACVNTDNPATYQGAARALTEIITNIDNAVATARSRSSGMSPVNSL